MKKTNSKIRLLAGMNILLMLMLILSQMPAVVQNLKTTTIGSNISTANLTSTGDLSVTGTSTLTGATTVTGTLAANGTLDANGVVTLGDGGDTLVIDTSDWDINATGDMTGIGSITANGTIATTGSITAGSSSELVSTESGWIASGETWTYASADDPTYTFTISADKTAKYSAGMRLKLTQTTGGTKYFIVTKVAYSDPNTTMTVYGGTDYDLNNEAISSPLYSGIKAPVGFPLDPIKWTVTVTDTGWRTQGNPTQNTWYNLNSNSISIPIGIWRVFYECIPNVDKTASAQVAILSTLSTANNSQSDNEFTSFWLTYTGASTAVIYSAHKEKVLNLSSKTSYYLNFMTDKASMTSIDVRGDLSPTVIKAVSSYL